MPRTHSLPHQLTWIGHLTFAVLACLAGYFFKERTVILDAAYQSFDIIRRGWFAIQVNRYGAAMTQVFPLVALKLKLPLNVLLLLYSLGFVLVHWIMYTICERWLKVKSLGFAIVLFNVFMVNHTFYWVQNEIIQAVSLNLLFWAILVNRGKWGGLRWYDYPILVFLGVTLAFFHPLTVFPFAFVAGYFLLDSFEKRPVVIQRSLNLVAVALMGGGLLLKYLYFPNNYDTKTTGRFSQKNIEALLADPFGSGAWDRLTDHWLTDFHLMGVALIVVSAFYIHRKKWLKMLFMWAGVVGYVFMVMASYIEGGAWFHVESQYLPVSIIVILPLVWEVFPSFSKTAKGLKWTVAVLLLAIGIRLFDIVQTSTFYTQRYHYIGNVLQKTWPLKGKKFIIDDPSLLSDDTLLQNWSLGYETLYYSALQSPDSTRNISVFTNLTERDWRLSNCFSFISKANTVKYEDLPKHLFNFTDSTENYRLIERWQLEVKD